MPKSAAIQLLALAAGCLVVRRRQVRAGIVVAASAGIQPQARHHDEGVAATGVNGDQWRSSDRVTDAVSCALAGAWRSRLRPEPRAWESRITVASGNFACFVGKQIDEHRGLSGSLRFSGWSWLHSRGSIAPSASTGGRFIAAKASNNERRAGAGIAVMPCPHQRRCQTCAAVPRCGRR